MNQRQLVAHITFLKQFSALLRSVAVNGPVVPGHAQNLVLIERDGMLNNVDALDAIGDDLLGLIPEGEIKVSKD